jgi:hypothetical protein
MVSVTYKPFMLTVVVPSVVAPFLWHILAKWLLSEWLVKSSEIWGRMFLGQKAFVQHHV